MSNPVAVLSCIHGVVVVDVGIHVTVGENGFHIIVVRNVLICR